METKSEKSLARTRTKVFAYVTGISITTMLVFGLVGYYLDMYLGTQPLFMIILVLVSFPINQLVVYKVLKKRVI